MNDNYQSTHRCDNCHAPRSAAERCEHEFLCAPCIEADTDETLEPEDNPMPLYECQCVAYPRPIERLTAENSLAARYLYADRHGCELLEVIARRVDLIDGSWKPVRH